MKTEAELQKMTVREIADDAKYIIATHGLVVANDILKNHIKVINEKMAEKGKEINKKLGMNRKPPKIRTITQFLKFK